MFEADLFTHHINEAVNPRDPLNVCALKAGKAQCRSLH
jgi:hypothetical protein